MTNIELAEVVADADDIQPEKRKKHPKCLGWYDEWSGDFDCDYGTTLTCDECKYGVGTKDPEAKVNQI